MTCTWTCNWGAGFFVGLYPVEGRIGVFVGGPRSATAAGAPAFVERVRGQLRARDQRMDRALTAVVAGRAVHPWSLTDVRAATWSAGRVGLVGDVAAGFLPTAGVGAAMAMESAGVLATSLVEASPGSAADALRRYESRQRPRVEAAQQELPGPGAAGVPEIPTRRCSARCGRALRDPGTGPRPDPPPAVRPP